MHPQLKEHTDDQRWMAHAVRLAERGRYTADPNPLVGCVLVKARQLVAEGFHLQAGGAHAERECLDRLPEGGAAGAVLYVTLEPCCHHGRTPPCVEAVLKARPDRVVIGQLDPNPLVAGKGRDQLVAAGIEVTVGVLEAEVAALNPGFNTRMRTGLPFVKLKMAGSLDGRSAMASGQSQWITSVEARQHVQCQRAGASVIVSGIRSVMEDRSRLTVRPESWASVEQDSDLMSYPEVKQPFEDGQRDVRQPVRCVLDARLQMPLDHPMLSQPGQTWLLFDDTCLDKHNHSDQQRIQTFESQFENVRTVPFKTNDQGRFDPAAVIKWLGQQGFNTVWVEAGATLLGSFVAAKCWDEFYLYLAPKFLGHEAQPLLQLGVANLQEAPQAQMKQVKSVGADVLCVLKPGKQ